MVMGAAGSKLEKALGDQFPEGERYFGLENFGNTCYCNSVLQVFPLPNSKFFSILYSSFLFLISSVHVKYLLEFLMMDMNLRAQPMFLYF